jgi:hypothetical protein
MGILGLLLVVSFTNPPGQLSQDHADQLWELVQSLAGQKKPPPVVYFSSEEEPPVSSKFLAFYYEHTNVIRMSPRALRWGLSDGIGTGYVYLVLGHEMLHYALVDQVPVQEHHCLFVREHYRERIAEFLVRNGIGHPFLQVMHEDANGCDPRSDGSFALDATDTERPPPGPLPY